MVSSSYIEKIKKWRNRIINEKKRKKVYSVRYGVIFLSEEKGKINIIKPYFLYRKFTKKKSIFFRKKVYREF